MVALDLGIVASLLIILAYAARAVLRNIRQNFDELRDAVMPALVACAIAIVLGVCGSIVALGVIHH